MSDALSFAEIDGQHVELLPARLVLSAGGGSYGGGDGGHGGDGGNGNEGGNGYGGHGGDAFAISGDNVSFFNYGEVEQESVAHAEAGDGGPGVGGDVDASGGAGGDGGDDVDFRF